MRIKLSRDKKPEALIEDAVMRHAAVLGYGEVHCIRRVVLYPGEGIVDLVLLPKNHSHKIVLVEAKQDTNREAAHMVVGQLLNYYISALNLSTKGLQILYEYAEAEPAEARRVKKKTPQRMCGGIHYRDAGPKMTNGEKLTPADVGLVIALDGPAKKSLKRIVDLLRHPHKLPIRIVEFIGTPLQPVDIRPTDNYTATDKTSIFLGSK